MLFQGFAQVWTAVMGARLLRRRPVSTVVAGEPLVFFRDAEGRANALLNRCPHRGVKLSLGKVTETGCLQCPFHAWEFSGDGAVQHIPLNPDAKRERLGATAIPVRERGGLLWIFTAPGAAVDSEPVLPETLTAPDLSRGYVEVEWNAHWSRVMENMLDSPHVPYVHAKTIGRFMRPKIVRTTSLEMTWEETPSGGRSSFRLSNEPERTSGVLEFYRPNIMVLTVPIPNQTFRIHALCIPTERNHTRLIVVGARSFARFRGLNPIFNWANRRIAEEDRAIVESSDPVEIPQAHEERSVRTDKPTLQFRKYYHQELNRAAPASAPVGHP